MTAASGLVMPGDQLRARPLMLDGAGDHWAETGSGLVVPTYAAPPAPLARPIGVDLFCGAGGFSLGMHQAGFHVAAASEISLDAAATYLVNLGGPDTTVVFLDDTTIGKRHNCNWTSGIYKAGLAVPCSEVLPRAGTGWIETSGDGPACEVFFFGDVTKLTGQDILGALGRDDVDCVFGGPPCQGFSKASGRSLAERRHDPRNQLVFEFARLVLETHARTFVMENVPQLLTMLTPEGVPVIDALARVMADGGFGTYDAIRQSLTANVDAGAVLRGTGRPAADRDEPAEDVDDPQLSLFGDAATPHGELAPAATKAIGQLDLAAAGGGAPNDALGVA